MSVKRYKDLTNLKFGYLTAIRIDPQKSTKKHTYWFCKCDCGKTRLLQTTQLTMGKVTSCGCKNPRTIQHEIIAGRKRMYSIYLSMKGRCYSPKSISYKYYGDKGITVCDEWRNSFENFSKWAENNGYDDSLSIDRIDNSKGYTPDNCRWIPFSEQANNKTTNVYYTHNGKTHTLKEWCEELDFSYDLALSRRKRAKKNNITPSFEYVFKPKYSRGYSLIE